MWECQARGDSAVGKKAPTYSPSSQGGREADGWWWLLGAGGDVRMDHGQPRVVWLRILAQEGSVMRGSLVSGSCTWRQGTERWGSCAWGLRMRWERLEGGGFSRALMTRQKHCKWSCKLWEPYNWGATFQTYLKRGQMCGDVAIVGVPRGGSTREERLWNWGFQVLVRPLSSSERNISLSLKIWGKSLYKINRVKYHHCFIFTIAFLGTQL